MSHDIFLIKGEKDENVDKDEGSETEETGGIGKKMSDTPTVR